jgi:hypothetical protein
MERRKDDVELEIKQKCIGARNNEKYLESLSRLARSSGRETRESHFCLLFFLLFSSAAAASR